jgi:hypothetical protein
LATELGISSTPGQELAIPPLAIQKLVEEAARAGGEAPLPEPPKPDLLQSLQSLYGNELARAVFDARDELLSLHKEWSQAESTKQLRLGQWTLAQRLAAHARTAGLAADAGSELLAVEENRSLLEQPDPVAPIVGQLADALRTHLAAAVDQLNEKLREAKASLERSPGWASLDESSRERILSDGGLHEVETPAVGDTTRLIAFLDATSLTDLRDRTDAIRQRLVRALTAVAQATKPHAKVVRLRRATIQDGTELERYLDSLRRDIETELGPDTPVIVE